MTAEALEELDALDESTADRSDVLETRLFIFMRAARWRDALRIARRLCELFRDQAGGYIHAAFCLHELGETRAARSMLLSGPASLSSEPTYHYNLACYECALGNYEVARAHLETSVQMDRKFRDFAKTDPDLEVLRKRPARE